MNLTSVVDRLRTVPEYRGLLESLSRHAAGAQSLRLPRSARPMLAAAMAQDLSCTVIYLVSRADRLLAVQEELNAWAPDLGIHAFPEPNALFYEPAAWGPRTIRQRAATLAYMIRDRIPSGEAEAQVRAGIVVASARAAMTGTLPIQELMDHTRWVSAGQSLRMDRLLAFLVDTGYEPGTLVTEPGGFSHRGGLVDIWPPLESVPSRLEFDADTLETIRHFDPGTQRSVSQASSLLLSPAREALPRFYTPELDQILLPEDGDVFEGQRRARLEYFLPHMHAELANLLDYLPQEACVLFDDRMAFEDVVAELEEQALSLRDEQLRAGLLPGDTPRPYCSLTELTDALPQGRSLDLGHHMPGDDAEASIGDRFSVPARFGGQVKDILDHLQARSEASGITAVISRQAPRLSELWSDRRKPAGGSREYGIDPAVELVRGQVHFVPGALTDGFVVDLGDDGDLAIFSDAELFGWGRPRPRPLVRQLAAAPETIFADLRPGDLVVHVDYGIGRFAGLVERTVEGMPREYLQLEYAGEDQLFVPIHQSDRVTRYVGSGDRADAPALSRLGTQEWESSKARARQAVEEVARDMLDLYARRMTVAGHAFAADTPWQHELEGSFPYVETDDQLSALQAVTLDMETPRPMDRLICGDVGYGKTEVALRASFKAVMDGKQVAVLVPTTVLAQQHFNTFRQRLAAFPVAIEMLSRFRTRAEAAEIVERLARGEIDIIIGTHRLLQKDVRLRDLGLLVIDEEQRFGVTHKEFLKGMRTEVDVLTLTATPIPRTLYMALTGARDISTITTPPDDRLPVFTHVGPYEPRLVRQAILRELDRGGQVFYVHNRVQTIKGVAHRLGQLVPEAALGVAHGQMHEKDLSQVMERFTAGEIDVLLSTSIIESGLDFPNANTLIVDRADTFGLSQLYQLRGRVGRSTLRAFAYFFRDTRRRSTPESLERLETIAEHHQLGAGYSIAMRDLEMRGAGDILGTRQHGHITAIGFHLYTRLLAAAIERLRAGFPSLPSLSDRMALPGEPVDVSVELPLPMGLPSTYIPDRDLRLRLYRRIAQIRHETELATLDAELTDRFGAPPLEVQNLLYQIRIRNLAYLAGLRSVSMESGQILMRWTDGRGDELPEEMLEADLRQSKRGVWLAARNDWQGRLLQVLQSLEQERRLDTNHAPAPGG
jgi:transcription-repair coupling factor (superfamily II helicase)